jgi:hypothetical protein
MADTEHTPPTSADKERAAWQLLNAQIAHFERSARWEPYKALAAMAAGVALFGGLVIALSSWHQPLTVNFGQPLHVQMEH